MTRFRCIVKNWLSTTKNGTTETRTFDVTNALLCQQVGNQTTNLNYDLDGNLKNDNKFHYAFDAFQRIVEVKDQSQNLVAKYQMDTSNRRISKTIGTTVHRTVYAGWQVAEEHETAPSGKKFKTTTKVYVYGQYIDEPLVMQITKPSGNQKKCSVEEDHPVTSVPPLPRWELLLRLLCILIVLMLTRDYFLKRSKVELLLKKMMINQ